MLGTDILVGDLYVVTMPKCVLAALGGLGASAYDTTPVWDWEYLDVDTVFTVISEDVAAWGSVLGYNILCGETLMWIRAWHMRRYIQHGHIRLCGGLNHG